jgi:hypothetical protein
MDSAVVTLILPSEKSLLGDSPILHMLKSFLNLWTDPCNKNFYLTQVTHP